jgi:hypothetical protein
MPMKKLSLRLIWRRRRLARSEIAKPDDTENNTGGKAELVMTFTEELRVMVVDLSHTGGDKTEVPIESSTGYIGKPVSLAKPVT